MRTWVFSLATFFAFLEIALGAAITNLTIMDFNVFFVFAALDIAAAGLTILTLPVMLILSRYRKGAFTSIVAIEVGWIWVLCALWLSVGALSKSDLPVDVCIFLFDNQLCPETQALTAFGFLTWILLFVYNMTFMTLVFRQQMRGNTSIWTGYVLETDFAAPGPSYGDPSESKGNNINMGNFTPQNPPVQVASQPGGYVPQPTTNAQAATTSPYPQV